MRKKAKINKQKIQDCSKEDRELDNLKLQQLIFNLTEENVNQKFSDEYFDRENEKIQLLGGQVVFPSEIKVKLDLLISQVAADYTKRFPQEFYDEIFRLNNWVMPKNKTLRPHIVGRYTNEIIYMRFTKEGLLKLQSLNPYVGFGVRKLKHFQLLTAEGKRVLDQFIYEAVECMKECDTWYEFRLKYGERYNLNVQLRMFEENIAS